MDSEPDPDVEESTVAQFQRIHVARVTAQQIACPSLAGINAQRTASVADGLAEQQVQQFTECEDGAVVATLERRRQGSCVGEDLIELDRTLPGEHRVVL